MAKKDLIIVISSFTARIRKRIQILNKSHNVRLIYITRNTDNDILRKSIIDSVLNSNRIGIIENGKYLKRLFVYLKLFLAIKKYDANNYYFFGTDFQIFLPFIKGNKYLEIGDLRTADMKGIIYHFFDLYNKVTLYFVTKLILTSEHHYNEYYKKYIRNDQVLVLRNRLPRSSKLLEYNRNIPLLKGIINIGLFGMLRYERPMDHLINFVIKHNRKYRLIIYGIPFGKYSNEYLKILSLNNENITWKGKYLYPDDLEEIYNQIDLSFVVYDNKFENVRTAIPNKLYESVLFNKPILCAMDTKLAEEVLELGIGMTVPISDFSSFEIKLLSISQNEIKNMGTEMMKLKEDYIFENDNYITDL